MILIISKTKKQSAPLTEMFHFMGVLSHTATPTDALSEISPFFSSVIIISPELLADKEDYTARLRSYSTLPIFALTDKEDALDNIIFDGVIKSNTYAPKIFDYITSYADSKEIKLPGTYKLAGIDASVYLRSPIYFDKVIPLTKTETMILRALICAYPTPLKAKEILKYAFRQTKLPEESNIRTHVSIMNRKFREITDRNLVVLTPSSGYRVLTPEIIEALIN